MKTQVTATFLGGLFKPDEVLSLAERSRVNLTIEPVTEPPAGATAWESLKARLRYRPVHASGKRFTRDELHERR